MIIRRLLICLLLVLQIPDSYSAGEVFDRHVKVAMRMIGDQLLLHSEDSTSRVLAVKKLDDRYLIEFEEEFDFDPEDLIDIVDNVVQKTNIATGYLVEVEDCNEALVIYSYELLESTNKVNIPCRKRAQPKGCYRLYFTILDYSDMNNSSTSELLPPSETSKKDYIIISLFIGLTIIIIGAILYFLRKRKKLNTELLPIGSYLFDKKGMMLTLKKKVVELSSKETDLLFLLLSNENKTLEREYILKVIWGDEGDYIGRTLDVYISKLRKKLENDPSLKIINIRGVGYRFVMN